MLLGLESRSRTDNRGFSHLLSSTRALPKIYSENDGLPTMTENTTTTEISQNLIENKLTKAELPDAHPIRQANNNTVISTKNDMSMLLVNIRSLSNNWNEFLLEVANRKPDIIFVTETWAHIGMNKSEFLIHSYHPPFSSNQRDIRGGGVAIYCASYINVREDDALLVENYDAIRCRLLYANREVVLGCCYHTERTDDENFANGLYKLSTGNMEKNVAGDFNHRSIDWKALSCSGSIADQRFLDIVQDNFLSQHVVDPTRGQNVLDLVFSSEPDLITECIVEGKIGSTDHNTVIFSAAIKQRNLNERSFSRRNFWKMDVGSFLSDLKGYDWNSLLIGHAEQQWNMLMGTLNNLISKHVPFVERRKRKYPWITKQVLRAGKDKRRCWKNLQSNNSVEKELKYMHAKLASDQSVKWSKKDFERKLAKGIREDSKSFWRYFSAKKKCPTKVGPLKEGDRVIEKSEDMAEHLNSYFQPVFTQEPIGPVSYAVPRPDLKMPNMSITVDMVLAQLLNLRVYKAAGPDGIPPLFLKLAAPELAEPLTKIFRESLSSRVVPTGWKVANVSALFKKGKRSEAANYRPVSLTSVICKCFERIVQQSVFGHLKEHNLISDTQKFMKG